MDKEPIKETFIKVTQPLGDFYVGSMRYEDLMDIAFADVRRIERDEQTGYESYFGIQRKLSKKRVEEISTYVRTLDATFPSSVLLAIDEYSIDNDAEFNVDENPNIFYDQQTKELTIKRKDNLAHIIDGQHRIFGLRQAYRDSDSDTRVKIKNFQIVVTVFVNMDDENQALVFSTINKAHTKVNKSLVYDLFDLAKTRSPQRVVHNIVKLLNERENSPFKDKVKMLGFAEDKEQEIITQATLAELIQGYISKSPMVDRDDIKRGKKLQDITGRGSEKYFFREWFKQKEDAKIAKLIWNYFKAVEKKWEHAWGNHNYILTKSTGIITLMRFLKDVVQHFGGVREISLSEFEAIFEPIKLKDEDFINEKYRAGGVGQADLYKVLKVQSGL